MAKFALNGIGFAVHSVLGEAIGFLFFFGQVDLSLFPFVFFFFELFGLELLGDGEKFEFLLKFHFFVFFYSVEFALSRFFLSDVASDHTFWFSLVFGRSVDTGTVGLDSDVCF